MSQTESPKKAKHAVTIVLNEALDEEWRRIREYCDSEGLYLGRFLIKTAIRHIEQVQHERVQKFLKET